MANTKGRTYAENLVGQLDRSALGLQRDVAQQTANTNWKNIQNQYENLQAQLKQKQKEANENYANGLVGVAGNSFDRMRNAMNNISNRNLINSGIKNIMEQSDIKQKGQEVDALLDEANKITEQTASNLADAGTNANAKGNELAGNLAKTLGNITARDLESQNAYNSTLASLAEKMESREDQNDLVAQQVADTIASARRSASGSKEDNRIEELYKRQGMMELIGSSDLSDDQKVAYLAGLYEVQPGVARNAVEAYNTSKIDINKFKEDKQNEIKRANKELKNMKSMADVQKSTNETRMKEQKLADRAAQNYDGNNIFAKALIKAVGGKSKEQLQEEIDDAQRNIKNKQQQIQALKDELNNFSYKDIYDILYK